MGRLVYAALTSLDGYAADEEGRFDWAAPDAEVHDAVNKLQAGVSTMLLGRRIYDVLVAWETVPSTVTEPGGTDVSPQERDYSTLWHGCDKVVFSATLAEPPSARTRIVRDLDPDEVRRLKAESPGDLAIGGPTLAGQALAAGLVDEVHLFAFPVLVGGGLRALPSGLRAELRLREARRFDSGVVHSGYDVVLS
ncbi:dihydrofolate reductase family protein [Nocardioides sp. 616]|uniref:dihydrofolate reductase family protein n=1 Tax=Nocardioides sp. 616 TaxID=2268090 RepID=UPI000CE497FD|nr:dihydrofolate reductase family protein [Nocardioides sp. 616]